MVVSYTATTAQPGLEWDASGNATVCITEEAAVSSHEIMRQNTYLSAVICGHRLYPFAVEAPVELGQRCGQGAESHGPDQAAKA